MNPSDQKPSIRGNEIDRVIADFGRKPPEHVRQRLHEELSRQKETFLALERIRQRGLQGERGRGR